MRKIWKYPINSPKASIEMPLGAEILTVQVQNREVCIWVLVDPEEKVKVARQFEMYETGQSIDGAANLKYLSTIQMHGGPYILHIFEVVNYV